MTYKEFVDATIRNMSQPKFEELKKLLLGDFITFYVIDHKNVTIDILAEKVCDYFSTLEIKTGKTFEKHIKSYLNTLDSIIEPHIMQTPRAKKGDTTPIVVPRSRKYYEKAVAIKRDKKRSMTHLVDYTRIMMCLYTAVNQNDGKPIENFDYAAKCLIPSSLVDAMKNEEIAGVLSRSKRKRFDTGELYSDDVCTLIILILILFSIINEIAKGEDEYE